jgi:hypothetical protein
MSRFSRAESGHVRTWAPPESPLRIEYAQALLREVHVANTDSDAFGVLYGVRHGQTIRLVSTRCRAGLEPVGIFAARVRGEIFLTEEDLERFEKAESCVALVISGENAGFFVRDVLGSLEAVRSYQEFSIHAPTPQVVNKSWSWQWCPLLLLPLLYFAIPRQPAPPLELKLHEEAGCLLISWTVPTDETLVILDGGELISIPIAPPLSTITYARRSGDVTVGIGTAQARFVGALPPGPLEMERSGIAALESKVASLRAAQAAGQLKIAALQRRLQ